jgi:hypothetical protein
LIVDSDRAFPRESAVWAYWLTRCEGFTVRSGSRVLGVVESIDGSGTLGRAETLHVRSRYKQRVLDVDEVTAVVPGRQLLISVREPAPPLLRPAAGTAARTLARVLGLVAAALTRFAAYLAPRVTAAARVGALTSGRLSVALATAFRRDVLPTVTAFLAQVVDEVERLTMLDGEPQPERDEHGAGQRVERAPDRTAAQQQARPRDGERVAGQPQQGQAAKREAERQERRNRARELREQAREEEEHLRVAEIAERALP